MIHRVVGALLVAVALAAGLIVYANRPYTGYAARVILADAGGLQQGSNVMVGGVDVGQVASLYLNRGDRAVAVLHIDRRAAPIGRDARATVQIDGFFGERMLILDRGDYRTQPQPSGSTIPVSRSGASVRLDDVVDSLNADAQGALRTFLDEQGTALVGRGGDLGATLSELPQTLPALSSLMNQLSANQQALGALVDHSDRLVADVAAQRAHLGDLVNAANGALAALTSRRAGLGETVQEAPATIAQARSTLATLQGAAIPLAPAADGLRATAPSLTAALAEAPAFTRAAVPTLDEVAAVAPRLQRLADVGTPVVRALVPLTAQLDGYSRRALAPLTTMLADRGGAANLFGEMEGWARSTQGYDASSHIFRFGATISPASFKQLLAMLGVPGGSTRRRHRPAGTPPGSGLHAPSIPVRQPGISVPKTVAAVASTLGGAVGGALGTVRRTTGGLAGAGGHLPAGSGAPSGSGSGSQLSSLLGYLTGK